MEKICSECGRAKPISRFYKDQDMADGRRNQCKACVRKRQYHRYHERHPDARILSTKEERENLLAKGLKKCFRCGEIKSLDEFHNNRCSGDGKASECRTCTTGRHKRDRRRIWKKILANTYDLTEEEYAEMLGRQGGCAICGKTAEENGQRLAVDHNHKTGQVRGLLCTRCNLILGNAEEEVGFLRAAIEYLQSS